MIKAAVLLKCSKPIAGRFYILSCGLKLQSLRWNNFQITDGSLKANLRAFRELSEDF